jgi:hypothetical protein
MVIFHFSFGALQRLQQIKRFGMQHLAGWRE